MVDNRAETEQTSPNGRVEANKALENDSRGLHVPVLPSKKPRGKLRAWFERQKIGVKLWLYMIEGVRFVLFYLAFAFILSYFLYYHQWQEAINIKMLGSGVIG
jgi:hypothetical protein